MWAVLALVTVFVGTCSARVDNIINGVDVKPPGKYPWQGSLQKYKRHICGGSVIGDKWFMTAAHCVKGKRPSDLTVVLGMHDKRMRYGKPKRYTTKNIFQHERYKLDSGAFSNDIAIMELNEPIEMSRYVAKIDLDRAGEFDESSDCVITGWGYTRPGYNGQQGHTSASVLQEAPTQIIDQERCKQMMGRSAIYPGVVCVHTGRNGACMGDSGGPLVCRNGGGKYKLVGATSWGSGTCQSKNPSMYTRVSKFISWVDNVLAGKGTATGGDGGSTGGGSSGGGSGGGGSGGSGGSCRDNVSDCRKHINYCNNSGWLNYMKKNCQKTCRFC